MEKQTTGFVLGLIGSILGFLGGICSLLLIGSIEFLNKVFSDTAIKMKWYGMILWFLWHWGGFIFAVLGIVASVLIVHKKGKLGGWLMIISSIGLLVSTHIFGILPFVLLMIGGIVALSKKKKN